MIIHRVLLSAGFVLVASLLPSDLLAAPVVRVGVVQRGDFVLVGNTLGHDCGPGVPAPIAGTVGACGTNTSDSGIDVFWRADAPVAGNAEANTGVAAAAARSTAMLTLPAGAIVTHAYLYWSASGPTADTSASLARPSVFSTEVTATASTLATAGVGYAAVADVTTLVQTHGAGAYQLSGVSVPDIADVNAAASFAGWWLVVLYEDATAPARRLVLFDGLDTVTGAEPALATIAGFSYSSGVARLGVVAFDGDDQSVGDALSFDGDTLSDAANPIDNVFNSTRSLLGSAQSVSGDLPQLTGTARSMSGIDLDVFDVTAMLVAEQSTTSIEASTTGDTYALASFIVSIPTDTPDLSPTKAAMDLDGGQLLPGDTLRYTIEVVNDGGAPSEDAVLADILPAGVTYVPGSIVITAGANAGAMSDADDTDQCEYVVVSSTVTCRLGTGANDTNGGTLAPAATTTVRFDVVIDANASGVIANQAAVTSIGLGGAYDAAILTDGDGATSGAQATSVTVVSPVITDAGVDATTNDDAASPDAAGDDAGTTPTPPGGGCGCATYADTGTHRGMFAIALVFAIALARRRRA